GVRLGRVAEQGAVIRVPEAGKIHRLRAAGTLEQSRAEPYLRGVAKSLEFFPDETRLVVALEQQKVLPMKGHLLEGYEKCLTPGIGRYVGPIHSVHQRNKSDFLALRTQLLRHFQCDGSTHAVAAEKIGPPPLQSPDFLDIAGRHVLDAGQESAFSIQSLGLQAVERLVSSHLPPNIQVINNIPAGPVNAEERRARPVRLHTDQRRPLV